jgi:hypothetical protein
MIRDRIERWQDRAFTRTDLLAALSVTLLLALLQLSAANHDATQRDTAVCLSNLRRLNQAWLLYASDNRDFFPPNLFDGGRSNWVYGVEGTVPDETTILSLQTLVDGRYSKVGPYSRDPTIYRCPADQTVIRAGSRTYFHNRSFSANHAVGTKRDGMSPVDGAWLDGNFSHTANRTWYTFSKLSDVVRPTPAQLWMLIDEDGASINDGNFAVIMSQTQMIDWPATRHDMSATISYADGSAEIHRWRDQRTIVRKGEVSRNFQPGNEDLLWLQNRTTRRVTSN